MKITHFQQNPILLFHMKSEYRSSRSTKSHDNICEVLSELGSFEIDFSHTCWLVRSRGYASSTQCISCKKVCSVFKCTTFL